MVPKKEFQIGLVDSSTAGNSSDPSKPTVGKKMGTLRLKDSKAFKVPQITEPIAAPVVIVSTLQERKIEKPTSAVATQRKETTRQMTSATKPSKENEIVDSSLDELDAVLRRSEIVGSVSLAHYEFPLFQMKMYFDPENKSFFIVRTRDSQIQVFDCVKAQRYLDANYSVHARDENAHDVVIGLGKLKEAGFEFKIEEDDGTFISFFFLLDKKAGYYEYLTQTLDKPEVVDAQLRKFNSALLSTDLHFQKCAPGEAANLHVSAVQAISQRGSWESESDCELDDADMMRLRGELPVVAAPVQMMRFNKKQ